MKQLLLYVLLLLCLAGNAQTQHEYFFNNNLTGTGGGGTLTESFALTCGGTPGSFGSDSIITADGLCSVSNVFCFTEGSGLSYPNNGITTTYSISIFFKFDAPLTGYSRIIDFSNSGTDYGIYLLGDCLNFYNNGNVGPCPYFQQGVYYLFTFVRDGSTNIISVYVNGTLFSTYNDASNLYTLATPTTPIIFFRDDEVVKCEDKPGCIKYASVSSAILTATQVDSVYTNICSISLPPCNATISYPNSPYSASLSTPQNVTQTGTTGGRYSSTTGLTIDSITGAITPSTSTPGTYTVTYTVASCTATATVIITAAPAITCDPSGNTIIFANYDGGILNINVDVNIPNLRIGIISYENAVINITGAYAGNVTKVVWAGFQGTNNNCNLGSPIDSVTINGIPPSKYEINRLPNVTSANPNGHPTVIVCAYSCNLTTWQGGCNTIDQVVDYFNTELGAGSIYSLNAQYCCWQNSTTYSVSTLANRCCASSSPAASISYTGSPYCTSNTTPQAVTQTGSTGGYYSASPGGLNINTATGAIVPGSSTPGTYTVTYTVPGCPNFTTTASVTIATGTNITLSYPDNTFCPTAGVQNATVTGGSGGRFTSNTAGLSLDSLTGAITPSTSTPGNYVVLYTVTGSGGCSQNSASANISISPAINTPVNASICPGATYNFGAQVLDSAGTYTQTLTSATGCDSVITLTLSFTTPPTVTSTAATNIFCPGDSVEICATAGFTGYLWNGGENTQCIYGKFAGNYYVTATDANNCTVRAAATSLNTYSLPPISVTVNGDTLTALNGTTYQWYLNGTPITGGINSVYVARVSGLYTVKITDNNGCSSVSNGFQITVTGLDDLNPAANFSIYPNPNSGALLTVQVNDLLIGGKLEILNAKGQKLYTSQVTKTQFTIEADLAPGVYLIQLSNAEHTATRKLIRL